MKAKIMKTARELFRKRGLKDVNIDEICRELGMSKKTFYNYFDSKESLVGSIVEADFQDYQNNIRRKTEGQDLVGITLAILDVYRRGFNDPDMRIREDIVRLYPDVFRAHAESRMRILRGELRNLFDEGVKEGLFRADIDFDLTAAQVFLLKRAVTAYIKGDTELQGRRRSAKSMITTFITMVAHAYITDEGIARCRARLAETSDRQKTENK